LSGTEGPVDFFWALGDGGERAGSGGLMSNHYHLWLVETPGASQTEWLAANARPDQVQTSVLGDLFEGRDKRILVEPGNCHV
jgi:hypothetical protein